MTKNDDYTTGNLLDFSYHQNYFKPIGIDLSRQTNTNISQQINFKKKMIVRQWFLLLKSSIKQFPFF